MILYFTGTGNSEYAAKKLAAALGEETMPLMERIRHNDTSPLESETPWIVCTPTYAWQLPHIVRDHLRRTLSAAARKSNFVRPAAERSAEAENTPPSSARRSISRSAAAPASSCQKTIL